MWAKTQNQNNIKDQNGCGPFPLDVKNTTQKE